MRESAPGIFARGLAMGAADIVPGVSGGTIALITGIYDRLIAAIVAADVSALQMLIRGHWAVLWHRLDGAFMSTLLAGILISIFSMASLIHWLLEAHPQPLWAFFSGLILISGMFLLRDEVVLNRLDRVLFFAVGVSLAVGIALMPPVSMLPGLVGFFFAGSIAICAMILPGISGSFMLLLMGMYAPVLAAVKGFQVTELVVFALGCGVGLLSFARLLDRLLRAHRSMAMAFLCGVLLGSLVAVWPWRVSVILALGAEPVEVTRPVLPFDLPAPQLALCLLTFCAGVFTVWATQKIAGGRGG